MALLDKLLKRPEILAAIAGAGGGVLTGRPGDDPLVRAGGGAAVGVGLGGLAGAMRRLIKPKATPQQYSEAVKLLRQAVPGITPQQSTQMPPKAFTDQLQSVIDMKTSRLPFNGDDIKKHVGRPLVGSALIAGAGAGVLKMSDYMRWQKEGDPLLPTLGYKPGTLGLMAFQEENGLPPTGVWNDETFLALSRKVRELDIESEMELDDDDITAPSLKPPQSR